MTDEDLKAILAKYQQKSFELFNQNIVLETQVEKLNAIVNELNTEFEKLKKSKKNTKIEESFQ
jgi:dynactin complex subunit